MGLASIPTSISVVGSMASSAAAVSALAPSSAPKSCPQLASPSTAMCPARRAFAHSARRPAAAALLAALSAFDCSPFASASASTSPSVTAARPWESGFAALRPAAAAARGFTTPRPREQLERVDTLPLSEAASSFGRALPLPDALGPARTPCVLFLRLKPAGILWSSTEARSRRVSKTGDNGSHQCAVLVHAAPAQIAAQRCERGSARISAVPAEGLPSRDAHDQNANDERDDRQNG